MDMKIPKRVSLCKQLAVHVTLIGGLYRGGTSTQTIESREISFNISICPGGLEQSFGKLACVL
jgi:hypothetical protein